MNGGQGNHTVKHASNVGVFSDNFSSVYSTTNKFQFTGKVTSVAKKERNLSLKLRNTNTVFVPYKKERNTFGEIIDPTIKNLEDLNLQAKIRRLAEKNSMNPLKMSARQNMLKTQANARVKI